MSFLGNVVWFLFGGLFTCLGYVIGGLLLCLTIIGIPFGLQAIKIGFASLAPFGKEVYVDKSFSGPLTVVFNILWLLIVGWELAIAHLVHAAALGITIIGIPFAVQHLKLIPMSLMPFGQDLR
jgi:uncharacterized membrane protein YccF (DUF307 family)